MKLLQIEYKKIVGNKSFKVFSIMFLVLLPLLAILFPIYWSIPLAGENFYPFMPTSYEAAWYSVSFISSWFCFFLLSFILIYHITNEYNYRTVRQNIIDGQTRTEYLKGKIYLMLTILFFATVYVFIIGFVGGLIFSTFEPKDAGMIQTFLKTFNGIETDVEAQDFGVVTDGMFNVIRFFIQNLGAFSLAFLIGFLAKRGILAILIFFGLFLSEKIGEVILEVNQFGFVKDYLPTNAFMDVLPYPNLTELLSGISSPASMNWTAVLITIIYSVLFIFFARMLFFKRDIT